jgi:hypothetical protein
MISPGPGFVGRSWAAEDGEEGPRGDGSTEEVLSPRGPDAVEGAGDNRGGAGRQGRQPRPAPVSRRQEATRLRVDGIRLPHDDSLMSLSSTRCPCRMLHRLVFPIARRNFRRRDSRLSRPDSHILHDAPGFASQADIGAADITNGCLSLATTRSTHPARSSPDSESAPWSSSQRR